MATENDADTARRCNGRELMKKGVHSIGVEAGISHGHKGWVVVAHISPEDKIDLPATLPSAKGPGAVDVPLVIRRSQPFSLE